jgi:hypothetical protein
MLREVDKRNQTVLENSFGSIIATCPEQCCVMQFSVLPPPSELAILPAKSDEDLRQFVHIAYLQNIRELCWALPVMVRKRVRTIM